MPFAQPGDTLQESIDTSEEIEKTVTKSTDLSGSAENAEPTDTVSDTSDPDRGGNTTNVTTYLDQLDETETDSEGSATGGVTTTSDPDPEPDNTDTNEPDSDTDMSTDTDLSRPAPDYRQYGGEDDTVPEGFDFSINPDNPSLVEEIPTGEFTAGEGGADVQAVSDAISNVTNTGDGETPVPEVDLSGLEDFFEGLEQPSDDSDGVMWGLGALGAGLAVGLVLWVVGDGV